MTSYSVGGHSRRDILKISAALAGSQALAATTAAGAGGPAGQIAWGVHVSLAPTWFDPAETAGTITPFMVMYALHDAMVKPMSGSDQRVSGCWQPGSACRRPLDRSGRASLPPHKQRQRSEMSWESSADLS